MAYDYKVNSYEVYKSDQPLPQIAADVIAYDAKGNAVAHKTVIMDADMVDKAFTDSDPVAAVEAAFIELIKVSDPVFDAVALDEVVAKVEARDVAWATAQAVVDKLNAILGGKIGLIGEVVLTDPGLVEEPINK
jgi:hypothetical protein